MNAQAQGNAGEIRVFAGRLVNPGSARHDALITVRAGKITGITSIAGHSPAGNDLDARQYTVIPGLIDIHCHGAMGEDFRVDCTTKVRTFLASRGTTGFLATFVSGPRDIMLPGLDCLRKRMAEQKPQDGAQILGIRCEGPFLEPSLGAQLAEHCWTINAQNVATLLDAAGQDLLMLDLSPELPQAVMLIEKAVNNGVIVSAAHTQAGAEDMERAFKAGLSHVTHIFNATKRPEPKAGLGTLGVGVDEFALTCDAMTAEVIADCQGYHVSPYWLDILIRCKGQSKVALISDGVSPAGRKPGNYPLKDGRVLVIRPGEDVCWLETGPKIGLCGSAMTIRDSLRNFMRHLQMNLEDALESATLTPARILGLQARKGSLEIDKDADLVVVDEHLEVIQTMAAGEVVFDKSKIAQGLKE